MDRGALALSGSATVLGGAYREPISLAIGRAAGAAAIARHRGARRAVADRPDDARHPPDHRRRHHRRQQLRAAEPGGRRAHRRDGGGADAHRPRRGARGRADFPRRQCLSDRERRRDRLLEPQPHRARPGGDGHDAGRGLRGDAEPERHASDARHPAQLRSAARSGRDHLAPRHRADAERRHARGRQRSGHRAAFGRGARGHRPRARARRAAGRTRPGRALRRRFGRRRDRPVVAPDVRQAGHPERRAGVLAKPQGQRQAHLDHRLSPDLERRGAFRFAGQREPHLRFPAQRHDRRSRAAGAPRQAARPEGRVGDLHRNHGRAGIGAAQPAEGERGKDFDFFRWQEDRDRIEKFLREDDHFEARVWRGAAPRRRRPRRSI